MSMSSVQAIDTDNVPVVFAANRDVKCGHGFKQSLMSRPSRGMYDPAVTVMLAAKFL
jgi:hypothetical protein